jgi:hypothetical protein
VAQRGDPPMRRAVLKQHHPRHRPAWALLAVLATPGRRLHQASRLQRQPGDRVAQRIAMPFAQLLVEVLDGEVGVFLAIQPTHPLQFGLRRAARRDPAKTLVTQTVSTFFRVTATLAAEVPA